MRKTSTCSFCFGSLVIPERVVHAAVAEGDEAILHDLNALFNRQ